MITDNMGGGGGDPKKWLRNIWMTPPPIPKGFPISFEKIWWTLDNGHCPSALLTNHRLNHIEGKIIPPCLHSYPLPTLPPIAEDFPNYATDQIDCSKQSTLWSSSIGSGSSRKAAERGINYCLTLTNHATTHYLSTQESVEPATK